MTTEAVLATDGHTYELAAIAAYFKEQNAKIEAAKQMIATGKGSKWLRYCESWNSIPGDESKMENLSLASNKAARSMAHQAASNQNKTLALGSRR